MEKYLEDFQQMLNLIATVATCCPVGGGGGYSGFQVVGMIEGFFGV